MTEKLEVVVVVGQYDLLTDCGPQSCFERCGLHLASLLAALRVLSIYHRVGVWLYQCPNEHLDVTNEILREISKPKPLLPTRGTDARATVISSFMPST